MIRTGEYTYEYAPLHLANKAKEFPLEIDIEENDIEWDKLITFDKLCGCITTAKTYYDMDIISLFLDRMSELEFERPYYNANRI